MENRYLSLSLDNDFFAIYIHSALILTWGINTIKSNLVFTYAGFSTNWNNLNFSIHICHFSQHETPL